MTSCRTNRVPKGPGPQWVDTDRLREWGQGAEVTQAPKGISSPSPVGVPRGTLPRMAFQVAEPPLMARMSSYKGSPLPASKWSAWRRRGTLSGHQTPAHWASVSSVSVCGLRDPSRKYHPQFHSPPDAVSGISAEKVARAIGQQRDHMPCTQTLGFYLWNSIESPQPIGSDP